MSINVFENANQHHFFADPKIWRLKDSVTYKKMKRKV